MRLYDYAASGNCYKVRLLLALLGTDYERVPIDIFGGDTLTDEYARVNPVRETPVLQLDTGETIAQSNAILWYLAEGTRFLPGGRSPSPTAARSPTCRSSPTRTLPLTRASISPSIPRSSTGSTAFERFPAT